MKSKLYQQRIDEALDSVPIEQGGTAARTKETACENLGLVSKDQVRGPGGIIILGEDGLISKSDLPPDILNNDLPSLFGPQDVELGATVPYYITNYASDVQYDITVSGGTFTRDVDCIFFTAQETSTQGSIQVNARTFPLWIGPPKPMRPVILTPEAGLEQGPFVKFTASDYIARKSGDLHAGSEWQVSTTIGFDVIVAEGTITELAKLKAWTSSRLERDTQYFARVRYLGSLGGVSEWSVPHLLKTRVSFIPEFYMATVGSEAYDGAVRWRSVDIDGVGDRVILGDPTVDEDPNYDTGAIRIFRRAGQDFVEEATMLDHPLSLNTEIRLQIPVGGVVEMTTDSELTGNQTYTASTVFYAPSDASYVTLVGKGTDAIETLAVKPQQGLLAYPEGLPVYNAGQAAVAETGDMYYPDGLPVYVPAQLGGVPEYPDGLPPYDPFGTDGGVWEYPDGLPPYDPAFPRIPQQGSPDYPNGLPPYDDGQAYIAPTGHPSYPNGLPPYEPAGQVYIPGDAASVSYNGQTYLFPGGQDGRATFTTVTLNFLANQSEHYFGKEVSLSKDGKVAAASGNTSVWKGLAADLKIPPGAQIEFNIFSPDPVVETYFQDSRVGIPKDAYQVELTGKGAPGSAGTVVPAATQTLSASGSVTVPKGVRLITATGKGGPGSVILSPQQGLPEYPNGLPVYNAGQAYVADIGLVAYPSGLPPYNAGQAFIADIGLAAFPNGLPVYNAGQAYVADVGLAAYPSGLPVYNPGQPYIAPKATTYKWSYSEPLFVGTSSGEYGEPISESSARSDFHFWYGQTPPGPNSAGSYAFGVWSPSGETASYFAMYNVTVTAVVDVQGTPGQPYIAPTGNPSYPSGLPAYVAGQPYIAPVGNSSYPAGLPVYVAGQPYIAPSGNPSYPTGLPPYVAGQPYIAPIGNAAYPSGLPPYSPPGTPQVGLPEYPNGLPVYNAGQPYIAPTGNPSYPSGLTPYDPGQAYVAPTAPVYGWNTSSAYASTTPTAAYPYSTIAQVTTAFGAPSGDGQSKSSGYSIQETGTYYTQYTVTSVAYQVTAYSAGQPYIAPIATTYKWKYAGPIFVRSVGVDWTDGEPVSKAQALSTFLSTNGSAPLSANSTGSYLYGEWGGGSDPGGYWNEWRVTVTAVVDVQGTPGQPYIAPTEATFAWGTPTITQTATGVTSNSFAVVAAAGDAMNTAGTPTAAGQTFSRNVATSYGDTQYKNYTVSATSYTVTAGSPGQPYIAPSGNPSYPGGLPAYNPGQPYIPSTGNPSYPSGLQPYSPAGVTSLMGPDSTFTINGQSYIFPGGKGTDRAIEKAYDITLPGLTALEGIFTIATGGSGKVAYENGVIPNRTIAPLNTTVTRDGSIGISRAITTLTLRGKGQDGTRTTVTAQQGLPEYPNGLPVYNAGQSYIAPAGLPAYPTGLPPYNAGQAYVAPTGDPNYPNGLPVYNAGQPYIAPTGSSSYPNGLPPYNPGQPYIAPTAAVYGWNTTETLSSTTTSPLYAYNLLSQVISTFDGKVTGNGQTKSGGYSVQEAATLYSNYSVSSVAYQATAYNPGQPYIAPKATTYKWKYAEPIYGAGFNHGYIESVSKDQALSTFLSTNGSAPLSANSTGSYWYGDWGEGTEAYGYWNEWRVTVTAVVDVQGTPGQPYIAPTAATFAWGTPTVTMTATDQISTGLPVVMGVSDAMSTAGTPTYKGQTFNRSVATSYAGTVYKNYAVSGTSYTVTAATPGQVYIAPVGSSSYPSGLPTYNPGQSYIAPSGNVSYPSGLPVYNAGQPYIAPTGNPSYPSGLPPYSAGQPLIAATGNVNYPSGLPVYKPAVITTTSGQNTTFTINGQTYTFQGGQDGASATSRIETVTLPGTVDQTGVYTVPMGGSIEISHYGGTVAGNAVPALNLEIVNTGYLTLESGLTVLEVTLKGGDGEIAIVEPEQGLLQFPNGLPRYVPGSSPQVGDSRYPDGLPIYRQATAKTIKGQDSTFTINGQTYIFEGGNGQPATERTEVIQLPGTSTLTATYAVAENVIGMVKHAAYEVWISAGYPAIARINNTIYVFPGGETGSAPVTTHSVPLVSSWNVGSVSTTLRTGESWSPPSVLTPEVDQEHLFFGTSISLDGTGLRMAVSGPGYDQSKGAVWLYVREDGYWKREAFLTPKDLNANDLFGQSVCLSQDGLVLAIGAPQHQQRGAVYLYQRIQGTWYFQAKVMADDPQQTDDFGTSVSLNSDGRILAVGAPGRDYAKPVYEWDRVTEKDQIVYFTTYDNAGAAFTFQYSQGVWSQTAELRRSEAPGMPISFTNNHFGTSVSLDGLGTALVVGVPGSDYGYGGMGAVSTYIAQGPTWTFYKEVKPDSYSMGTLFARRLRMAASGQYMIANANGSHIVDGQYIQGASLVFSVEERAASTPLPPIMLS